MKFNHGVFIVCFWLCCVSVQGQVAKNIKWGVMGSVSNTNFNEIKPFSRLSLTGYKVGLFANKEISSKYEASLMLNFSQYGGRSFSSLRIIIPPNYDSTFYNRDADILYYLNLYPGIKFYPNGIGNLKPFIGFGLFFGYLLKSTRYNLNKDGQIFNTLNQREFFYKFNYGVNIDLGMSFRIGKNKQNLITSLSYEPGLFNTGKNFRYNPSILGFRTHSLNFNIFYTIL